MGGKTGGDAPKIGNLREVIDKAKEEIKKGENKGKKNVFISFAYEDIDKVNLLRGQAKNEGVPVEFNDWSVSEKINSERAPYIKQKIIERIERSSATVIFLSNNTPNSEWVDWEINQSIKMGKNVIGVYTKDSKPRDFPKSITKNKIVCIAWRDLAKKLSTLE